MEHSGVENDEKKEDNGKLLRRFGATLKTSTKVKHPQAVLLAPIILCRRKQ